MQREIKENIIFCSGLAKIKINGKTPNPLNDMINALIIFLEYSFLIDFPTHTHRKNRYNNPRLMPVNRNPIAPGIAYKKPYTMAAGYHVKGIVFVIKNSHCGNKLISFPSSKRNRALAI
jgi:hypothetical protein